MKILLAPVILSACYVGAESSTGRDLNSLGLPESSQYAGSSPWGVAPSHTSAWNVSVWKDSIYDLRIANVRGFRVDQPALAESLNTTGFELTGILQWSSATSPGSVPSDDLSGWEDYIRATLDTFPYVTHWEVWNEPPNFTNDKNPASYAAVVARAYDVIKSVDPGLQVGLAAKSTHLNYMARTIESGARDKFDFVTLHPYEVLNLVKSGHDVLYMNIVGEVRKMLASLNPGKVSVPVRFTEVGIGLDSNLSADAAQIDQAAALVKAMTMSIAQGVEKVYWFEPLDAEGLKLGLMINGNNPRKALFAFGNLVRLLGDSPVYLGWTRPATGVLQHYFRKNDEVICISWADSEANFALESGDVDVKVIDLVTNKSEGLRGRSIAVGNNPVVAAYPLSNTEIYDRVKTALGNRSKILLSHDTDFGLVDEVSISPGVENGIRILGESRIATANGEQFFDLSRQQALAMVIDPSFFTHFRENVELVIELRAKKSASSTPGFNLKVDAYSPAKVAAGENSNSGWNSIASTEFYQKTWKIEDLTSTGSFGYQLQLDSDSTRFSQYEVKKISVRRVD
ncbi:hypothetical protein [uncultured Microbulbifer sp.]|uniref:hypothetical protein n=1 Tax=uncultured Microbulbifer sp. TaxID=348147 RepID=UPI0025E917D2|nr:hypothetical protein [uncultured Microbulbifer sp.]